MSQTTLSVRMDEHLKRQFDAFCANVGMNASVAVNMFVKAVIRERRIPFEIASNDDPFQSGAIATLPRAAKTPVFFLFCSYLINLHAEPASQKDG
jgi:addiction module RelB/DinJ family antitoxin